MTKTAFTYGLLMALCLLLYKVIEAQFLMRAFTLELTFGMLALLFTGIGIWAGLKYGRKKKNSTMYSSNSEIRKDLGISKREYEVLELLAAGLSNQEIADKLFLSLNTIKTHSSNLYSKLGVKRRVQAIEKAREMGILTSHTKE